MKITDVETTLLAVPFEKPTIWPYGRWDGITIALIELKTDEGITGIGESVCQHWPAEAFKLFIDSTKAFIVGEDPFNTERILKKLEGIVDIYLPDFKYADPNMADKYSSEAFSYPNPDETVIPSTSLRSLKASPLDLCRKKPSSSRTALQLASTTKFSPPRRTSSSSRSRT